MATVKAVVRKAKVNSKGEVVVYIRYGHQQKSVDISTQFKVPFAKWNEEKQIVNSISSVRKNNSTEDLIKSLKQIDLKTNTRIETYKAEILSIARSIQLENLEPDVDFVKERYIAAKKPQKGSNGNDRLIELFKNFIENSNRSDATKSNYLTAVYHLEKYEKARKRKLTIKDIHLKFYDDFVKFLYTEIEKPDESIGLSGNTVGTSIKNLKVFLSYLKKRGYDIPDSISEFKVTKLDPVIYFLTEKELAQLENKSFNSERLSKARDLFVFNCYTGLRYSDLCRLTKDHLVDGVIQMRAFKNQKDVYVPLTPMPEKIWKKYGWKLPILSEQKLNNYIKEACEEANITKQVEVIRTVSGNKTYSYVPKHQVMTSHIAVKTFISLCVKKGISPKSIAEMTGKSVQVILRHYYGIDQETIKDEMKRVFN